MAKLIAGSGILTGGMITFPSADRVSPVLVSLSLGTAPMSPGASSGTWTSSLPCMTARPPSRSEALRTGFLTVTSAVSVPVNSRKIVIRPA